MPTWAAIMTSCLQPSSCSWKPSASRRAVASDLKIQPWVTNEFLDLWDQRRQLKQQKYTSTEGGLECRKVNREVRKKMKAHRPCLLTLKKGSRLSKPSAWGNFSVSPTWSTRLTTGCGVRSRSSSLCVHRISSGNCQETGTCMVRACNTSRQPLQNHPSGHLGGLATLW